MGGVVNGVGVARGGGGVKLKNMLRIKHPEFLKILKILSLGPTLCILLRKSVYILVKTA